MKNCSTKKKTVRVGSNLQNFKETCEFIFNRRNEKSVAVNDIDESGQEVKFLCSQNTQDMFDANATFDNEVIWQKIMDDVS